jgi:hypothetical protein
LRFHCSLEIERRILREGNAYLQAEYPRLDFVKTATIETGTATVR